LIVGAPKCATSTVAAWLGAHPQLFVAPGKELKYFDANHHRGLEWYRSLFAAAGPGRRAGEATPEYLLDDRALDRMRAEVPSARLVVLLREPVERLWSQYWFFRAMGVDVRRLERTLAAERRHPDRTPRNVPIGYLRASRYGDRIAAVLDRFPRDQLLVEFYDDVRDRPDEVWLRLLRHLGVDDAPRPVDVPDEKVGRAPRFAFAQWLTLHVLLGRVPEQTLRRFRRWNLRPGGYPAIPLDLAQRLHDEFAPDLDELERQLGRPVPAVWRRRPGDVSDR
jgi:hypothetical protein